MTDTTPDPLAPFRQILENVEVNTYAEALKKHAEDLPPIGKAEFDHNCILLLIAMSRLDGKEMDRHFVAATRYFRDLHSVLLITELLRAIKANPDLSTLDILVTMGQVGKEESNKSFARLMTLLEKFDPMKENP